MARSLVLGSWRLGLSLAILILKLWNVHSSKFDENFEVSWGNVSIAEKGQTAYLSMSKLSGSGFQSRDDYLFGSISMRIKLPSRNTAGTVTAFYMTSEGSSHDELDFEFLGNKRGRPKTVQTNVFVSGSGNREQKVRLWFDPSAEFHNYSIIWNTQQIVFWVDSVPIRVFRNNVGAGVAYPNVRAMRVRCSLWNGEEWATDGGRAKIEWSQAPFVASFQSFDVQGCPANTSCSGGWWDEPASHRLNRQQLSKLQWVRTRYMIYDYCRDHSGRFSYQPAECRLSV